MFDLATEIRKVILSDCCLLDDILDGHTPVIALSNLFFVVFID